MNETLYQQYRRVKIEYPDNIALMRIGDFLEAFDDDARELAQALDLQAVACLIDNKRVPMVGFPAAQAEQMIGKLIEAGRTVALIEQVVVPPVVPVKAKKLVTQGALWGEP